MDVTQAMDIFDIKSYLGKWYLMKITAFILMKIDIYDSEIDIIKEQELKSE